MANILIIGATSSIAIACARRLARQGDNLYLSARNYERLGALASDLRIRGAPLVYEKILDVSSFDEHELLVDHAIDKLGHIDTVLIAYGTLPDQIKCQLSASMTCEEFAINAVSIISLLTILANRMENQKKGMIAVIGSVAGDRGRQSNYVYGSAKGAIDIFMQGLRNRLFVSGVDVLLIKPGFVDTPMTQGFPKGLLWVKPDYVARDIINAIKKRKLVCYTPWFWRWIMLIIRYIPERLFMRLKL